MRGIFCGQNKIAEESIEAFDKTMVGRCTRWRSIQGIISDLFQAINTRGTFLGIKYAIAQMLRQEPQPSGDRGWIVNISSIGGLVALSMERLSSLSTLTFFLFVFPFSPPATLMILDADIFPSILLRKQGRSDKFNPTGCG